MAKKKRGSKSAGAYAGLLNGVKRTHKTTARNIRKTKGVTAAVKYLRKHRGSKKR